MSELRALQEAFWSGLQGEPAGWLLRELDGERLAIYADMYRWRLEENLGLDFPALAGVLGAERFSELVAAYLAAHPSRDPSVRQLGKRLPAFVREPWLAELAALEWARLEVFDRADEVVLDDPRAFVEPARQVRLLEAHAQLEVEYAIEPLWRSRTGSRPERAPHTILVWRKRDGSVHHRTLAQDERRLLPKAARGLSFVALCDELDLPPEQAAARAVALVSTWCADELLRLESPSAR